jgi:hypothetical protein
MLAVKNSVISFLLTAGCEEKAQLGQASGNHGEYKVRFRRGKRTHTHLHQSFFELEVSRPSRWGSRAGCVRCLADPPTQMIRSARTKVDRRELARC